MKIKNNELKKASMESRMCYYFGGVIKIADFDFDKKYRI